jgi:ABC-2 type transport system permease protein
VTATPSVTAPRAAAQQQIAAVRVPAQSLRGELRAIKIVWQREMIRFTKDRLRIVTSLVQPFLFLFVLGTGLSRLASAGTHGVNLRTFVYPGVLCMAVMFIAVFSAASIVWDREFGFLREMMVAPVRRSSLVLGKCFGGATVAAFEGLILIALAGLVGVPYAPVLLLEMFGLELLLAFSITAFGVMAAARVRQMQSFMALTQMIIMPMRRAVFAHLHISNLARHVLDPGVTWFGWHVPGLLEAGMVAILGLVMLAIAIWQFARVE